MTKEITYPPRNETSALEPFFTAGGGFETQLYADVKTAVEVMGRYLRAVLRANTNHYSDYVVVTIPQTSQNEQHELNVFFDETDKVTGCKMGGDGRLVGLTSFEIVALENNRLEYRQSQ